MKKIQKGKATKASHSIHITHQNAAGIDIGCKSHFVAVPEGRDEACVKEFGAFTNDLIKLAEWLKQCKIKTVAMESTGVFWIPLYDLLEEHGFEVLLVNAKHVKNVPGKKTDVLDCQWIQQLHTYGLLRGSFRPKGKILQLRTIMRQREMLIDYSASHILHMQKCLSLMNIKLRNVIRDVTGATGMQIIRAIAHGETDPKKLAQYRDERCKNSEEIIRESLVGNYQKEHIFCLKQTIHLYDEYAKQIKECDKLIEKITAELESKTDRAKDAVPTKPLQPKHGFDLHMYQELIRITGVDLTAIPGLNVVTAYKVISEIGVDMSKWISEKHFVSWLSLCPGSNISGGKRKKSKTLPSENKAAAALRMSATSLYHSDSAPGAYYRRMRSRLGGPKANTAAARKMAITIYNMLKTGQEYRETGADYYERQYKAKCIRNLKSRAKQLGFELLDTAV